MSFNKKIIQKNFSDKSLDYSLHALIQKDSAQKLCNFARQYIKPDSTILDLGSGTSFIAQNFPNHKLIEVDIAVNMLKHWIDRPDNISAICADIENLPFKAQQFDIIFASFSLQWIADFDLLFKNLSKLLKKDGILTLALPINETFKEIKISAKMAELQINLNDFPRENYVLESLENNSFKQQFLFKEVINLHYKTALDCLKEIKKIGANYSPHKNFLAKNKLRQFNDFFAKEFHNQTSWHIIYLTYQNGNIF